MMCVTSSHFCTDEKYVYVNVCHKYIDFFYIDKTELYVLFSRFTFISFCLFESLTFIEVQTHSKRDPY